MKISIVMPSFNHARFIAQALQSVLDQQGAFELEMTVVDGGSTDGTLQILESMDDPRLTWTSRPDDGQADAINQGLSRGSGEIVAWLNSDDLYEPGTLEAVTRAFDTEREKIWLSGSCIIVDAEDCEIRRAIRRYKERRQARYTYDRLLRENFICQPATFWRRSAFEQVGLLDRTLHWAMDYDLWLRLGRLSDPIILDRPLARFRLYPTSKSGNFDRRQYDEDLAVAFRYRPPGLARRLVRRMHTEKIVLAYRVLKLMGR